MMCGIHNQEAVIALVEWIDNTHWAAITASNQRRCTASSRDLSPGENDSLGDFIVSLLI